MHWCLFVCLFVCPTGCLYGYQSALAESDGKTDELERRNQVLEGQVCSNCPLGLCALSVWDLSGLVVCCRWLILGRA